MIIIYQLRVILLSLNICSPERLLDIFLNHVMHNRASHTFKKSKYQDCLNVLLCEKVKKKKEKKNFLKKIFFDTWHGTCFWEKVTFLLKFHKNPNLSTFTLSL